MSWYSDGERFDEHDMPYCDRCTRGNSAEECNACVERHHEEECRAQGQRCETCIFYEWDVVKEIMYCSNSDSDWYREEGEDEGWCDKWQD